MEICKLLNDLLRCMKLFKLYPLKTLQKMSKFVTCYGKHFDGTYFKPNLHLLCT